MDPAALFANHHGQFSLVLYLAGLGRQDDRITRRGQAAGWLEEEQRYLVHGVIHLSGMRFKVTAHADDLGRPNRRQERDRFDREFRIEPAVGAEGIAIQLADTGFVQPAIAG